MGVHRIDEHDIMNLIVPYLDDRLAKIALTRVIHAMGYHNLPAVHPKDYAELHRRFSNVLAKISAGKPDRKWDIV